MRCEYAGFSTALSSRLGLVVQSCGLRRRTASMSPVSATTTVIPRSWSSFDAIRVLQQYKGAMAKVLRRGSPDYANPSYAFTAYPAATPHHRSTQPSGDKGWWPARVPRLPAPWRPFFQSTVRGAPPQNGASAPPAPRGRDRDDAAPPP